MDHGWNSERGVMKGCSKKYVAFFVVGGLMAVIGGVLFPVVDYVIREEIKKKVIISNTSETYDIWQKIPIPVYMQFWMFNVENPQEVLDGGKPYLIQKGPYTYREYREKFDIVWNPNGTVTYRQNRTFHFVREKSVGPDTEKIFTINPLMATVAQAIQWLPPTIRGVVSLVITASGADGMFTNRTVHELLFGYDDPTLVTLNKLIPLWFNETQIGFFIRKNYTDDGLYTVATGEKDISKLGGIAEYNGKTHVDIWTSDAANMVNGTDGTVGPPFRFDAQVSPMFTSDLCRSIRGVYKGEVESPQGIPLRRFSGDKRDMENATSNPNNIGFCVPRSKCLPTGLSNSTLCQLPVDRFMIPLIFSFPHFLYADPEVQNSVIGLDPVEDEHRVTVDVEPWTGMVMQVAKRVQINFYVEKIPQVSQTKNLRKLFFPVLWLNESSVVDNKHADMVTDQLFLPMKIMLGVKIALIAIGGLMVLATLAVFCRRRRRLMELAVKIEEASYITGIRPTPILYDEAPSPTHNHTQEHDYSGGGVVNSESSKKYIDDIDDDDQSPYKDVDVDDDDDDDELLSNHTGVADDQTKLLDPGSEE